MAEDHEEKTLASWSRLPAELQRMQRENTLLRQRLAQTEAQHRESRASEPKRRSYSSDLPRGKDGRVIARCAGCGKVKTLKAQGRCEACYVRWRRSRSPKPLGGAPMRKAPKPR